MKSSAKLLTNTSVFLAKVQRTKDTNMYEATIMVYGTGGANFNSGTVTIQISPNQGTTKINCRDIAGTVVSITQNDAYNIKLGDGSRNQDYIEIYATMASAVGATDVTIDVFDNM